MRSRQIFALLVAGTFLASLVSAQTPRGPKIRVSANTGGTSQVAVSANGDFVVTWQAGFVFGGTVPKVWYRLYRANGTPKGKAQRVSTAKAGEFTPAIGIGDDGRFVIVWTGGDSQDTSVFGRRFDAQGRPVGGRFRLSTITDGSQSEPAVALAADGSFVAAWTSDSSSTFADRRFSDLYVRRFDDDGRPLGPEVVASQTTRLEQNAPRVAMIGDGAFVLGWLNFGGERTFYDVFARRFAADGAPLGDEFQVNPDDTSTASQYELALAAGSDDAFVVVWTDSAADPTSDVRSDDSIGIRGQRYATDGTPVGGAFHVNAGTRGLQVSPAVTVSPQGGFFVSWSSVIPGTAGSPATTALLGRSFSPDAVPLGSDFVIDAGGGLSAHAMAPSGKGILTWVNADGVFARKLAP